jgi:carboxyl-terminal processing protease
MLKRIILAIAVGAAVLAIFSWAISATRKPVRDDLYRQVEIFADALSIVQSDYADETNSKDLIYGSLKGMLASLDPHSQFLDPDSYRELKEETEGKFGGIGIEITVKDGLLTVVTPIEDTPAWKAGVKANDRIVKINNELTRDMTISDAVKRLRGKPREAVNITVLRESQKKVLEFKIVREMIRIKDIKEARVLEDGIGYLRLVEFREDTPGEFSAALENLKKQGAKSLVLDLRNNPGGILDAAISVSQEFLEKGKMITYTKGRKNTQQMEFVSKEDAPLLDMPMVVLINEGSASGSEIVAAALQDYKRAIIVGTKSFGKGSVQSVIPLRDGSALRLTTSKYFSPLGREIHGKGITPDIVVEEAKIENIAEEEKLPPQAEEVFQQLEKKEAPAAQPKPFDYKSDAQLVRAVDILKAIKIYKEVK